MSRCIRGDTSPAITRLELVQVWHFELFVLSASPCLILRVASLSSVSCCRSEVRTCLIVVAAVASAIGESLSVGTILWANRSIAFAAEGDDLAPIDDITSIEDLPELAGLVLRVSAWAMTSYRSKSLWPRVCSLGAGTEGSDNETMHAAVYFILTYRPTWLRDPRLFVHVIIA
jgi:hypothetical protein